MGHAACELAKCLHFLGATKLALQFLAGRDVHERADPSSRSSVAIADDDRALEDLKVGSVAPAETVFTAPALLAGSERFLDGGRKARAIGRVDALLPESQVSALKSIVVTEESLEALRPGERSGRYIPIPNCIVRSPGNVCKIVVAF